jgi:hypothetical protein
MSMVAGHRSESLSSSACGPPCWKRRTPPITGCIDARPQHQGQAHSLTRTALRATVHCLTGCAIGEVLGMVIGTALALSNHATVVISVILAFFFGFALTVRPLLQSGLGFRCAARLALASDTVSITNGDRG